MREESEVRNNHLLLFISDVGWIRCQDFEILETFFKDTNCYWFSILAFNYLTNKVIIILHSS